MKKKSKPKPRSETNGTKPTSGSNGRGFRRFDGGPAIDLIVEAEGNLGSVQETLPILQIPPEVVVALHSRPPAKAKAPQLLHEIKPYLQQLLTATPRDGEWSVRESDTYSTVWDPVEKVWKKIIDGALFVLQQDGKDYSGGRPKDVPGGGGITAYVSVRLNNPTPNGGRGRGGSQ